MFFLKTIIYFILFLKIIFGNNGQTKLQICKNNFLFLKQKKKKLFLNHISCPLDSPQNEFYRFPHKSYMNKGALDGLFVDSIIVNPKNA